MKELKSERFYVFTLLTSCSFTLYQYNKFEVYFEALVFEGLTLLSGLFLFFKNLETCDLILEALLVCITLFFRARSTKEIACLMSDTDPVDLAFLTAYSRLEIIFALTERFLLELLRARVAVFVTGID